MGSDFKLHEAAFKSDHNLLKTLLEENKEYDINEKDKFGNTPLHLASMMGHIDCVAVLTEFGADTNMKNNRGWTPFAEVVSYGNRTAIKSVLKSMKSQNRESMDSRRPKLVQTLKELDDFQLELKWEFHSWVPIISRFLPSDTCKITKKGANIRMNTTLIEFTDMKWQRGDIAFLFDGTKTGPEALVVLDNEKKVYQKLTRNEADTELDEEIDYLMSSDIISAQMSTKPITFTNAQTGWIFKADKMELIGSINCEVYNVNGLTLISRKRREHLSEEDVQKNKAMVEAFQRGDSMLMENEKCQPIPRKASLAAPSKTLYSWEDYQSLTVAPILGRKMSILEQKKTLKASVWMSQDFPLSIELLLSVLNVVAPTKHFAKMKEFVSMKLPPGFPVKIEIPVLPTCVARITFQDFSWEDDISDDLFVIPDDYKEDPYHFPDLG